MPRARTGDGRLTLARARQVRSAEQSRSGLPCRLLTARLGLADRDTTVARSAWSLGAFARPLDFAVSASPLIVGGHERYAIGQIAALGVGHLSYTRLGASELPVSHSRGLPARAAPVAP